MARHEHADLIHQWAEGAAIEGCGSDGVWTKRENPMWWEGGMYRIAQPKPQQFESKVARMATQRSTEYFVIAQSNSDVLSIQANPDFIEWVR
jgi:hypothetical protein